MNSLGDTEYAAILSVAILALVSVAVLFGVVIAQNRTIKQLRSPRYGFLGKPLSIVAFTAIALFGVTGYIYYAEFNSTVNTDISVSDQTTITVRVEPQVINQTNGVYSFKAIPVLNGLDWGSDLDSTYDVVWTIKNLNEIFKYEYDLTKFFPGGIEVTLDKGINIIQASIEIDGESYTNFVEIRR